MSESDANRDLADTARMRGIEPLPPDPLEDTQRMDVDARRTRQREATLQSMAQWPGLYMQVVGRVTRERRKPNTVGERQPGTPQSDARQAVVDFLNQQQGDL